MTTITSTGTTIRVATAVYALLLAVVSLMPSGTESLGGWDTAISPTLQNALHVPAYIVLSALSVACLSRPKRVRRMRLVFVALANMSFGGLLELGQAVVPGRFGSVTDVLLNAAGVALGVVATSVWLAKRPAKHALTVASDGGSARAGQEEGVRQ